MTIFLCKKNPFYLCNLFLYISILHSYLKDAKEGDLIEVDARAVKTGKTLAYLECELRNKNTGQIIAKGSQTKFVASP